MKCIECYQEMERDKNNIGWNCKCGHWYSDEYFLTEHYLSSKQSKIEVKDDAV